MSIISPKFTPSLVVGCLVMARSILGAEAGEESLMPLSLYECIQRVAEQNESLQMRVLSFEAARQLHAAEKGVFEPEAFTKATKDVLDRRNTVEETQNLNSRTFSQDNNVYEAGIESLIPSGARVRLGYTLRDLENNLQQNPIYQFRGATNGEYQSFLGLTVNQPLLRDAWVNANYARIRIAALESRVAFQEYRKQSLQIFASAEATYWRLYLLEKQLRFLEQSVETARTILQDSHVRLDAGRGSELEVMEAEAGLALRRSLLVESQQRFRDAGNELAAIFSERQPQALFSPSTMPELVQELPALNESFANAYSLNADYMQQVETAARDGIALGYLKNQRLPYLNLQGSYGLSGLADDPGSSWDDLAGGDWAAWSVGVEFRVPLGGGTKTRAEYQAARLREQESLLQLRAIETQMLNSLRSAHSRIEETFITATNYQAQVALREAVLNAAMSRLDVGKIESRRVLEIEADLLETRSAEVEALVNHRLALLTLRSLDGTLLSRWNLDFSQTDLQAATAAFVRPDGMSREQYATLIRTAQGLQRAGGHGAWPEEYDAQEKRRHQVRDDLQHLDRPEWDPTGK